MTREDCESKIYSLLKEIDRTANILQCEEYRTTVSKNRCPLCDNLLDDDDDIFTAVILGEDKIIGCGNCVTKTSTDTFYN